MHKARQTDFNRALMNYIQLSTTVYIYLQLITAIYFNFAFPEYLYMPVSSNSMDWLQKTF